MEEGWLSPSFHKIAGQVDEKQQLLRVSRALPDIIQIGDALTFWSAIVTIHSSF